LNRLSHHVITEIERIVGRDHLCRDKEDLLCYAFDATRTVAVPDAVIFPGDARQISEVLKLANQYGFSVTPRGAGSGMTGGAVPVRQGVVLAMSRFNHILSIDRDNLIARVEPGVVTGVFQKAVEQMGLFYPPDPSSSDFSTLGGNAAECAGGPRAVKYGVTRDYVLGMTVVLPTGEIVRTGVQTVKGVVGYDLTRLMVGSEGTLGVITELTLRLLPKPEAVRTMMAVYDRINAATETVSEIIRRGIIPRTIEFMDNASIRCAEAYAKSGLPVDAEALLIIEVDGSPAETERALLAVESVCRQFGVRDMKIAASAQEARGIWKARKSVSPALYRYGPDKINEDIVVPRNRIPDVVSRIQELSRQTGLTMVCFGHAGDGNIHFNVMADKTDALQWEKALGAVGDIFDYTLALGGTLSGEHGVGITKLAYIGKEIPAEALSLMRRIKNAFDPNGILNPGKIFDDIIAV
jgi:glycolate oxidase